MGAVIVNHYDEGLVPRGYLGVDIFFVISGYVITRSLLARDGGSLGAFLSAFYARRFKRIVPALIACVLLTAFAASFFSLHSDFSLKTGFYALFGVSNIYLWHLASDYFADSTHLNFFTHTWSLGVEEQFYFVFPLLLWGLVHKKSAGRTTALMATLAVLTTASLVLFVSQFHARPMVSFYMMPARFWEMACGCMIAVRRFHRASDTVDCPRWVANATLALLIAALFLPTSVALFANIAVVVLATAALLVIAPGSSAYRLLTSPVATYLGLVSYSLYLWHWPILVLARHTIGLHWWSVPILGALTLLAAHLSYYRIERPLREASWGPTTGRTIVSGSAAIFATAFLVFILFRPLHERLFLGAPPKLVARNVETLSDPYTIAGSAFTWRGDKCLLTSDSEVGKALSVSDCTLGNFDTAPHRVLVLGNSYAAAFTHAFDQMVLNDHYAVAVFSSWGASPVKEVPNRTQWAKANTYYWQSVVPKLTPRLRRGDWVFLVSDTFLLAPEPPDAQSRGDLKLYEAGLRRYSDELARSGVRLAVLATSPFIRESECTPETAVPQWFAPGGGACKFFSKEETIARRAPVLAILRKLDRQHAIVLVDLFDMFCPGKYCTFVDPSGRVLYRDEFSHPSVEAAEEAAPIFRRLLQTESARVAPVSKP